MNARHDLLLARAAATACDLASIAPSPRRSRGASPQPATVDTILSHDPSGLASWQQVLCRMCDEMSRDAKLTEASVTQLVAHYGTENQASRAIMVMAWFNMLSRFVDSTGVPVETGESPYQDIAGPAASR